MQQRWIWLAVSSLAAAASISATLGSADESLIGDRQALIFQRVCAHCHVRPGTEDDLRRLVAFMAGYTAVPEAGGAAS